MPATNHKGRIITGILIITLGLVLLLFRNEQIDTFQLILGGLFLAGYFYKGSYGLLIPGCLLTGLALISVKTKYFGFSDDDTFGLGIGFIAIYVIDRLYKGKTHWWPLIPGVILILVGIHKLKDFFDIGWPVILIIVGIWIIINSLGLFKKKK